MGGLLQELGVPIRIFRHFLFLSASCLCCGREHNALIAGGGWARASLHRLWPAVTPVMALAVRDLSCRASSPASSRRIRIRDQRTIANIDGGRRNRLVTVFW